MHPLQTTYWQKARKQMGIETAIIDNYLLTVHKIPFIKYKIGYLPRSKMPDNKTLKKLYQFGEKNNLIFIKIEPYEQISNIKYQISNILNIKNFKLKIINSPHPLFPKWTQVLDITKSEDELLKNMHPKTRYNIRLAEKKGVLVKEMSNEEGFKIFSKLYFDTCKRQHYLGHNLKYHKIVWENLKDKIAHILIAFYNDEPLAAYQIWIYDQIGYYVYGGSSEKYRNLMGANLLMWESIKFAKKNNAKIFDMWGSLPPDYKSDHPWAGFTRFKSGYGTKFVEFVGSFDLIINPFLYQIYNFIYFLRQIYLKIKSFTF
ncbi:MAG: peptidoglycan bridge formation glycyltransferase FemA/FemB family protein [Candidatus Microgenomates bacterium]